MEGFSISRFGVDAVTGLDSVVRLDIRVELNVLRGFDIVQERATEWRSTIGYERKAASDCRQLKCLKRGFLLLSSPV